VITLFLPHRLAAERWWFAYQRLAAVLVEPGQELLGAYAAVARELVRAGHADLSSAIAYALATGEPPFAKPATQDSVGGLPAGACALLERDLGTLSAAARRDLRGETSAATSLDLPGLERLAPAASDAAVLTLREALLAAPVAELMTTYLAGLVRHGGGPAAVHGALRWRRGRLEAVRSPAAARLEDLVGLEEQLGRLQANTEALLRSSNAHNVLLYGPRGSGKSTAVRGLLTRYQDDGLRLVELPLEELADLPELLERLRDSPKAFVLFVDDLSFEEGDVGYRPLRTLLEGGLSGRPRNVALYATSNRRHLLKERFGDRPDPLDDDVHRWDTQHEKLALADRFGLTITFPDAGQRRYLELVRELARRQRLEHPALAEAAIRFAEWGNGYSGRTAAQFIASLQQGH